MHGLAAAQPWLAKPYLHCFRLAKRLPDARWKQFVNNSLSSISWPEVSLGPAEVMLDNTRVRLVPHLHEPDFEAHLYSRLQYERALMGWLRTRSYNAVLGIGANVGVLSVLFSKLWPTASIYAFEPSRLAYARLLQNLALNACENVFPFNSAVACRTGLGDFYEPEGHLTNGSLHPQFAAIFAERVSRVKAIFLNGCELVELIGNVRTTLLKVDVEGSEPEVIRSLEPLITSIRPDIVIEVLDATAEELNRIQFLRDGYSLFHLTNDGPVAEDAFVPGKARNYGLVVRR